MMARLGRVMFVVLVIAMCRGITASRLRYCGRQLADAMALVCHGHYNTAMGPQRSTTSERRYKRGIVDECCKRGCELTTLEKYCSPSPTPIPDNLQIRKRSEIEEKKTIYLDDTLEPRQSHSNAGKKFMYDVNHLKTDRKTTDNIEFTSDDVSSHHMRRLFGHTSGEFKMRHANRFFTLSDEVESQRHDPTYKHTTRHRDYVVIANKVKRNDVGKKHDEPLENFDIGHFSSHGDTLKSESERPNNNLNLIPNGETTSHSTLIRHHRDRYILKDKKLHKMDIRNKKGKVADDNAESPPPSQIGTISPYFLGRTLVLPSSRKSFNPHQ